MIAKPHYGAVAGAFGIVGALVVVGLAEVEGRRLMKDYSLEDPASKIRDSLLAALSATEGLRNLRVDSRTPASDELTEMRAALGSGTILDFRTTLWELMYDSQELDRYGLRYAIRSRLIRLDEQTVLWEGFCDSRETETSPKVPLEELKADSGAVLRERLEAVAAHCADRLFAQFAGRKTTN
jgi:hypothetical protein